MAKIGRNDPCHCGSGKKYKKCCWEKDQQKKELPAFAEPEKARIEYWEPEYDDDPPVSEDNYIPDDTEENDYLEDEEVDDDEYNDDMDDEEENKEPLMRMRDRPYPPISKEEDKIVDEWWETYQKLEKPDDIKKHIEDFLAVYPHLAENLELEHEVLFELGGDLRSEGRVEEYIDLLLRMRTDFPGVYSRKAGIYDADIIAWLIANNGTNEIGKYLSYYTEHPVEFVDQLFETLNLLVATDTAELVPEFVSKVSGEILSSSDLIWGEDILQPLTMHIFSKYISIKDTDAIITSFIAEVVKALPFEIERPDETAQFWKQRLENIKLPFGQWPADIPKKRSEMSERYRMICENFIRYMHEQTGVSWISAGYYGQLMHKYFNKILDVTKGKVKRQFDFSKNTIDNTIDSLSGTIFFFDACKTLSLLNAIYYFSGYLHTCGNISDAQKLNIESDCKKLFDEMYAMLKNQFTEALCFSEFPLWSSRSFEA